MWSEDCMSMYLLNIMWMRSQPQLMLRRISSKNILCESRVLMHQNTSGCFVFGYIYLLFALPFPINHCHCDRRINYRKLFFFFSLCSEKPFILELVLHIPTISIKPIIFLSLRDSFLETCIPRGQWQARLWESRWTLNKTVSSLSLFDKEIKLFFSSGLNASMFWKGLFT